jgi:transposase
MTVIGEDSSERLDVIPVPYRVIVIKRPKFPCWACVGIVLQAPAPERLIEAASRPRHWLHRWQSHALQIISRRIARHR